MKIKKLILTLVMLIAAPFFPAGYPVKAAVSPDAIAIRVMPNTGHHSPLAWYGENVKLQGSPQNLFVDGYEAVRDGRTVYVNAANISGHNFYTNIYIISYNQEAGDPTIDIFGQILLHWKFNTNPEINGVQKKKIIRDVKRLADLYDMNSALADYKQGDFPLLKSGSYVAGASVSVWPSWQATLGAELGIKMPTDQIINGLKCQANCCKNNTCAAGETSCFYDAKTCWNQTTKMFYFNFNATGPSITKYPVYWYKDGIFHVGLETGYNIISAVHNVSFNVVAPE